MISIHLGNRRVRAVGELMENQFRIGLVRMERAIKEKMSVVPGDVDGDAARPHQRQAGSWQRSASSSDRRSCRSSWIRPIHSRRSRISVVSPRLDRAVFLVSAPALKCATCTRPTTAASCPIETPEGPNIGLISSLSCFARINEYGFIESPYRRVKDGHVIDYVAVTNSGESGMRQGDPIEVNEAHVLKQQLAKDGKRSARDRVRSPSICPHGKRIATPSRRPTLTWTKTAS